MRVLALSRFNQRTAAASSLLAVVALLSACDFKKIPDACTVTIAPREITLAVNQGTQVLGTAFDCKGNSILKKTITYSSTNSAVVSITTTGGLLGVSVGTAKVSAVANGKSGEANVTVTPEHVSTITVTPPTITLRRGNTLKFTAVAKNNQGNVITGIPFVWASSNSSIATVDQSGNVFAASVGGPVQITASADGQGGQSIVTVTEVPIGSCSLAPANQKITVTNQAPITVTLRDTANNPLSTIGRTLVWTSSNDIVATVSGTGIVLARKAGNATITATDPSNAAVNCNAAVEIVDARIVTARISPSGAINRIGVPRQYTVQLLDSVGGIIPAGRTVLWRNVPPVIATVSGSGVVTGTAIGNGRVAVDAEGAVDTVNFTVTKVPVAQVTVAPLQRQAVEGSTAQFTPTVTDSIGNIVTDRVIDWLSSDLTKATVSSTGLATAIAPGTVTITASSEARTGQATLIITPVPVDTIEVVTNPVSQQVNKTIQYAITLKDAAGNILRNRTVLVSSDQPSIAQGSVNPAASIIAIQSFTLPGNAVLTLQAVNANNQAEGKPTKITVTILP